MALFLLCPNLGWIQGQFNFTELSLRYRQSSVIALESDYCRIEICLAGVVICAGIAVRIGLL